MSRQRLGGRDVLLLSGVALATTLGDLVSKDWARHDLAAHARHVVGPWWWRLRYNSGISFSLNSSGPRWTAVVTALVLVVVGYFAWRAKSTASRVGFGLVLGGGLGNLVDRVSAAPPRVTDFVAVGSFPVFNLADAAITVGVVTALVATWLAAPKGAS
ncbi:MAG TPA: signal peptidase II [Acidimicrobiales bacterium]